VHGLTYLFISHDLNIVQQISDRIGVMYLGKLVELGPSEEVYNQPLHPYTKALFGAIPLPVVDSGRQLTILEGNVPSPVDPPSGCRFHTRCPLVQEVCKQDQPEFQLVQPGRYVACHFVEINQKSGEIL
jgi:oligopeptide/dipeptide ABC transporter ATP-binding protein